MPRLDVRNAYGSDTRRVAEAAADREAFLTGQPQVVYQAPNGRWWFASESYYRQTKPATRGSTIAVPAGGHDYSGKRLKCVGTTETGGLRYKVAR